MPGPAPMKNRSFLLVTRDLQGDLFTSAARVDGDGAPAWRRAEEHHHQGDDGGDEETHEAEARLLLCLVAAAHLAHGSLS